LNSVVDPLYLLWLLFLISIHIPLAFVSHSTSITCVTLYHISPMFTHTIHTLPAYTSDMSIYTISMALMWGAAELLISIGFITAFSFVICYGFGAIMEPKEAAFDQAETPSKENTASIFMSAMLSGFHTTFVFFGLPLFGHAVDSFAMRLIYSLAIVAAITTGVAVGTIFVYLAIPAILSCFGGAGRLVRRIPTTTEQDIEAQHERMCFLDEKKMDPEDE
jgi:hypothetical protein